MPSWRKRDIEFMRKHGISRSTYYKRRASGRSHEEALDPRDGRGSYGATVTGAARERCNISRLLTSWGRP